MHMRRSSGLLGPDTYGIIHMSYMTIAAKGILRKYGLLAIRMKRQALYSLKQNKKKKKKKIENKK